MINSGLKKQLNFIREIDKLKSVYRTNGLFSSRRRENSAEHSWHLAMLVLVLAEHANEDIDRFKVIRLILVHDLGEVDAGDVFLFDESKRANNSAAEQQGARRIFGLLPKEQYWELMDLWLEFETGTSPEARFARALDHLLPVLQNVTHKGGSWKKFGVSREAVIEKNQVIEEGSAQLWQLATKMIHRCFDEAGD